jgi:hypothetical protein
MLAQVLWLGGALVLGGYLLLFALARRPVTLRLARLGSILTVILVLRLVLVAAGVTLQGTLEACATLLLGVVALSLMMLCHRVWLVRATGADLRAQVHTVCRGLFLGVTEAPPGRLQLAARGDPALRVWQLAARLQLLMLCHAAEPGKVALLCSWLAKQYPGPVPMLRFVLKEGGAS